MLGFRTIPVTVQLGSNDAQVDDVQVDDVQVDDVQVDDVQVERLPW